MEIHYSNAVESSSSQKSPRELLASPVTVLVGVGDESKTALSKVGVETVHDLATSSVFETAAAVYETVASGDPSGNADQTTAMTAASRETNGNVSELAAADIDVLEGVSESAGTAVSNALGVTTVRDLARWPPYDGARTILGALTGEDAETERGVPEALVPVARKYGTEEMFYTKVYVDQRVAELDENEDETEVGPLDREDILENFQEYGVTVDWTPQWGRIADALENTGGNESLVSEETGSTASTDEATTSDESENTDESSGGVDRPTAEALSLLMPSRRQDLYRTATDRRVDVTKADPDVGGFHQPAVGGVIQYSQEWVPQGLSLGQLLHSMTLAPGESTKVAVIDWSRRTEGQRQESGSQQEQTQAGMVQNRSIQEVQDGVAAEVQSGRSMVSSKSTSKEKGGTRNYGLFGMGGSTSGGRSDSSTKTTTVSTSKGRREIHAEMSQKIRNSTQQHASSSRTRRATVVHETEQEESEEVRTRIVTNHNHMHALSVHYYEVVQIFRTEVGPQDAQPVLFVPFKPLDFSDEEVIQRHRRALQDAALTPETRELIEGATGYMTLNLSGTFEPYITSDTVVEQMGGDWAPDGRDAWRLPGDLRITAIKTGQSVPHLGFDVTIERTGDESDVDVPFPDEAGSLAAEFSTPVDPSVPVGDVAQIDLDLSWEEDTDGEGHMQVGIQVEGPTGDSAWLAGRAEIPNGTGSITLMRGRQRNATGELSYLLNQEQLYYSQAVWLSLDSQTLTMVLAQFQIDDRSAVEFVDSTPEAVHGNYVAFPLAIPESPEHATDETYAKLATWWDNWTDDNFDPEYVERDLVPLPSGGVHGESILGRANGAEKLDITRFWDWQESPIPQQAPEIAPVQTGSRASDEDLTPQGFDSSIVQMQQPQSLPDPTGIGAALDVLGQSGIFRDMSGMEAAADVAKTTSQITGQGARHATDAAVETFKAGAKAQNQALSTVADTVTSLAGGGAFSAASAGNSSFGAMYNEAEKSSGGASGLGSRRSNGAGGGSGGESGGSGGGGAGLGGGSNMPILASGSDDGSGLPTRMLASRAAGSEASILGGSDSGTAAAASELPVGSSSDSSAQPELNEAAGREFQMARNGIGSWTWKARKLWTLVERTKTTRYPDESDSNVDRLPIPPWIDANQWQNEIKSHYQREHQELVDADPDTEFTRKPENILGDFGQTVPAEYFVIHNPTEAVDENYVGSGQVHQWLGADTIEMNLDWHERGNGVKLEEGEASCFVHVEMSVVSENRRDPGTGNHTFRQYWDLANDYVAASLRAGCFLTVTGHKEIDRSFRNGHADPLDVNMGLFYSLVTQSLALGDVGDGSHGFGMDASFGIGQDRMDAGNGQGQINEFIPYAVGNVPKADQYGEIRTPNDDGYRDSDIEHHATGAYGGLYVEDNLRSLARQCGGGNWLDAATKPGVPAAARPYLDGVPSDRGDGDDDGAWV